MVKVIVIMAGGEHDGNVNWLFISYDSATAGSKHNSDSVSDDTNYLNISQSFMLDCNKSVWLPSLRNELLMMN